MSSRPNILFIVVEHFNGRIAPGHEPACLNIPNLNRLRRQGVSFERAYCNSPVCGPSRMSFLTGLMPCHNEVYDNGSTLPGQYPTLAHFLTGAGYRTALSGRMHIHGLDVYRGFEERLTTEILNPLPEQRPAHPAPDTPVHPLMDGFTPLWSGDFHRLFLHDRHVTERAEEFLRHPARKEKPFFLSVGYLAAHPAARGNPDYEEYYRTYLECSDLPVPDFTEEDYQRLPKNIRRQMTHLKMARDLFEKAYHRQQMAMHFAALTFIDDQVGRLLEALEEADLGENTVVCFTADHGENMGRHGLWGKMNFYEEAVRVPLLMRGPEIPPGRRARNPVSLLDLAPTFLDYAGFTGTPPLDGRSLRPLLTHGKKAPSRDIFGEYHGHRSVCGGYMVIRGHWKYIHYPLDGDELYDMRNDPCENSNRVDDATCGERVAELREAVHRYFNVDALENTVRIYNQRREAVFRGLYSSPITRARLTSAIAAYRNKNPEPWWDGGRFIAAQEEFLSAPGVPI